MPASTAHLGGLLPPPGEITCHLPRPATRPPRNRWHLLHRGRLRPHRDSTSRQLTSSRGEKSSTRRVQVCRYDLSCTQVIPGTRPTPAERTTLARQCRLPAARSGCGRLLFPCGCIPLCHAGVMLLLCRVWFQLLVCCPCLRVFDGPPWLPRVGSQSPGTGTFPPGTSSAGILSRREWTPARLDTRPPRPGPLPLVLAGPAVPCTVTWSCPARLSGASAAVNSRPASPAPSRWARPSSRAAPLPPSGLAAAPKPALCAPWCWPPSGWKAASGPPQSGMAKRRQTWTRVNCPRSCSSSAS